MTNTVMKTWPVEKRFLKCVKKMKKNLKARSYDIKALEYYDEHDAVFFVVTHDSKLSSVVIYSEPGTNEFIENVLEPAELSIVEGLEGEEIIEGER